MFCCKFCQREFPSASGRTFHENRCEKNPYRKIHPGNRGHTIGHTAWNKGMTKDSDERLKKFGENLSLKYQSGEIKHHHTKHSALTRQRLSIIQQERIKDNPDLIKGCGHAKKYDYKGIILDGKWEVYFATYLDERGIKWERPKEGFPYIFEGRKHFYFPDFYIPSIHTFVEVKGYEREIDQAKWKEVRSQGFELIVIKESQIQSILKNTFDIDIFIKNSLHNSIG